MQPIEKSEKNAVKNETENPFDENAYTFVTEVSYPDSITTVMNMSEAYRAYRSEIEWCGVYLKKHRGYSIALPQIGVTANIALIRGSLGAEPMLVFNVGCTVDKKKKSRVSREADYSIDCGNLRYNVKRASKVKIQYQGIDGEMFTKVLRFGAKQDSIPLSAIFQNVEDHMDVDYFKKLRKKTSKVSVGNKAINKFFSKGV